MSVHKTTLLFTGKMHHFIGQDDTFNYWFNTYAIIYHIPHPPGIGDIFWNTLGDPGVGDFFYSRGMASLETTQLLLRQRGDFLVGTLVRPWERSLQVSYLSLTPKNPLIMSLIYASKNSWASLPSLNSRGFRVCCGGNKKCIISTLLEWICDKTIFK